MGPGSNDDALVVLQGVHKTFGQRPALQHVELKISAGEIVGFVGPNGSGKTTCLRILLGLVRRSGGLATIFGLDPDRDSLAIRKRCSYLPGETSVYAQLNGREFLQFALGFYGNEATTTRRLLLDLWPLPLDAKLRTYSAGMKQKLAVIATLAADVDLYILDEPDRALDASARLALRQVLHDLNQRGKTILLSSHHLTEVEALAHRLTFLMAGRTIAEERVTAARNRLRQELRLRLNAPNVVLPDGVIESTRGPDGTLRLRTAGDPLRWLQQVDPKNVAAVEVGTIRLEDLYQELTGGTGMETN